MRIRLAGKRTLTLELPMTMATRFTDVIRTEEALREVVGTPATGAATKAIDHIDHHFAGFIEKAPFVLIGSSDEQGNLDISPKGDPGGFVLVLDEHTLAIPDRPGNRRATCAGRHCCPPARPAPPPRPERRGCAGTGSGGGSKRHPTPRRWKSPPPREGIRASRAAGTTVSGGRASPDDREGRSGVDDAHRARGVRVATGTIISSGETPPCRKEPR